MLLGFEGWGRFAVVIFRLLPGFRPISFGGDSRFSSNEPDAKSGTRRCWIVLIFFKKNLLLFSVVEGVSTDFNEASVFTCVERTVTSVYYFLMNLDSPVIRALFVTARLRFVVCFALLLFFFLVFALTILRVSCSFLGPADTWLLTFGSDVFLLVFVDFLTGLYLVLPVFFLLLAFFRHC